MHGRTVPCTPLVCSRRRHGGAHASTHIGDQISEVCIRSHHASVARKGVRGAIEPRVRCGENRLLDHAARGAGPARDPRSHRRSSELQSAGNWCKRQAALVVEARAGGQDGRVADGGPGPRVSAAAASREIWVTGREIGVLGPWLVLARRAQGGGSTGTARTAGTLAKRVRSGARRTDEWEDVDGDNPRSAPEGRSG